MGARITDVHSTFEVFEGCNCSTIYFTVDRGFTFTLPQPGHEWNATKVPEKAEKMPDSYIEPSFKIKKGWFNKIRFIKEPSKMIDVIKRLKERAIVGVFCLRMADTNWSYEPDDSILLFEDGSQAYCRSMAPEGISTGLIYQTKDEIEDGVDLVNIFDVPSEK